MCVCVCGVFLECGMTSTVFLFCGVFFSIFYCTVPLEKVGMQHIFKMKDDLSF